MTDLKRILLLLIFIYGINSYALELWAKAGSTSNGTFSLTASEFETDPQPNASLELTFYLSEKLQLGVEAGINYLLINENEYASYFPVGGNAKFIMNQSGIDIALFINGGYNVPYVQTTYVLQDVKEVTTGPFFGFGSSLRSGLFMLEVNYTLNYADVTADVLQDDGITTIEETESTFISFLTFKFGYQLF